MVETQREKGWRGKNGINVQAFKEPEEENGTRDGFLPPRKYEGKIDHKKRPWRNKVSQWFQSGPN